jgi:hypothetical protein
MDKPEYSLINRESWLEAMVEQRNLGGAAMGNLIAPLTIRLVEQEHAHLAPTAVLNLIEDLEGIDPRAGNLIEQLEEMQEERVSVGLGGEEVATKEQFQSELNALIMSNRLANELIDRRDLRDDQERLEQAWPDFLDKYRHGLDKGIVLGYVPNDRRQVLEQAARKSAFRVVDAAILEASCPGMQAYYSNAKDEIGISHLAVARDDDLYIPLAHELTHEISGGTFLTQPEQVAYRIRVGYDTEIRPNENAREKFNEFLTQHVTMGILTGDFVTLDPDKRPDGDKTYYEARKTGAAFVEKSGGIIDIKTLINGFFEDTTQSGGLEHRRQMIKQTRLAYGKGVIRKLEALAELAENVAMLSWAAPLSEKLEELVFSRIHSPVFDDNGEIIKTGEIDLTNMPKLLDLFEIQKAE